MLQKEIIFVKQTKEMKFPVLSRSPLFSGLSDAETDSIIAGVNYRSRSFPAGAVVVIAGEDRKSVV